MTTNNDNIKVAVKARPLIQREVVEGLEPVWRLRSNSVYQTDDTGNRVGELYTFDHVFDQDCRNKDVYAILVHSLVESFMEGFNATIFTYGQTSSGKTHTMLGSKMEDGLFDLVVKDIFDHVASKYDKKYLIRCSYFEIYNEKINDLLDKSNQAISIREDTKGNMLLNAREAVVSNAAEVMEKMKEGNKVRRIGATCMNERSSRSHTIFRIILESKDADEDGPVQISQLNLVDLAGSERVAQTKAAGARLKEGVNINKFAQRAKNVKNRPEVNILSSRDEAIQQYQTMQHNLETRLKKQAELLAEMERHREECLIEIERLKVEATIVGHFQSGSSAIQLQKPSRRHTIGDYGSSSGKQYKPLKQFSQGGSSRKLYNHILVFLWRG
nr:unnamed protein product [Callosobruchus analis]